MPEQPSESPRSEFQKTFDELRENVLAEMDRKIKERLEQNPLPNDEEVLIGAYLEQLEPQVRDAIRTFYKKGYATQSSGFYEIEGKEMQVIDGFFEIDPESEKKLMAAGITVRRWEDYAGSGKERLYLQFEPAVPDIHELKKKWDAVADMLPDTKKLAYSNSGSEYWLDRPDIWKYFLERRLAMKAYNPEDEALIRGEIERLAGQVENSKD